MIEIDHLTKEFDNPDKTRLGVLRDVSLTVEDGDIYGIIGMSGINAIVLHELRCGRTKWTAGTVRKKTCDHLSCHRFLLSVFCFRCLHYWSGVVGETSSNTIIASYISPGTAFMV